MFCKNCGSSIKDGTKFCPKCGKPAAGAGVQSGTDSGIGGVFGFTKAGNGTGAGGGNFSFANAGNSGGMSGISAIRKEAGSRKNLWIILAAVAVVAIVAVLAVWRHNSTRQYSIVGEWESVDLVDMEELIDAAIEAENLSGWQANLVRSAFDAWYVAADNLTFVFYERGDFSITLGGVGISLLDTTYEQMPNGKLNLNFGLNGILKQLPVNEISYDAKCSVGKNKMTIELFGIELKFRRK